MNINLFAGLHAKKTTSLLSPDSQIFKTSKYDETGYDKFKEIMGNIRKYESAEYYRESKVSYNDFRAVAASDSPSVEETAEKSKVCEKMDTDNSEDNRFSIRKLKKIDEKMGEFISFLVVANLSDGQKLDDFTIGLKDGQVIASDGVAEIMLSSSFLDMFDANITANLDQMIKSIFAGNASEAGIQGGGTTIRDVLAEAIIDALNKSIQNQNILDGLTGNTGSALGQEFAAAGKSNSGNGEIVLTEIPALEAFSREIQLPSNKEVAQTSAVPIISEDSSEGSGTGANVGKDGRAVSLEQALYRLLKQIGITEDIIDSKLNSIISSLKPDSGKLGLEKNNFLNLVKKITVELSQLAKNSASSLEELAANLETGPTVKSGLNSHFIKSLRNSEAFEVYSDKFLKPFVFQQSVDSSISSSEAVNTGPASGNATVNLADVIMQISSKIINRDGPVIRQLEIMLKPESLGAIRIKVEAAGEGVSIKIQTQYSHTEEIISSNLDMLKNNLSEKGVLLKDLSVFMDQNTGAGDKSFEGFSGFGEALKQGDNPKQYREEDSLADNSSFKDSNGTGGTGNAGIETLSAGYDDTIGVDIVA